MSSGKPRPSRHAAPLVEITRRLAREVDALAFAGKVHTVYNPLQYARDTTEQYLTRYGGRKGVALMLGMNPGPWGMAQTGVPFGEVGLVRDWMKIDGAVGKPDPEHPKRPVDGLACKRSEVSGARLWGWAKERFGTPDAFFRRFLVWNYCPLSFMVESGANLTPDKLPVAERRPLFETCDRALADVVAAIEPSMLVGIGGFAAKQAAKSLGDAVPIGTVLHPSPASPIANRGWAPQAAQNLADLGLL